MPRLVLLLILIPLLAGGGVLGWYFFLQEDEPPAVVEGEAPPPVLNVVNMQPVMVSMIGRDRPEQFVTLRFSLEVADAPTVARVQARQAHLNSAVIETLYRALADEEVVRGRTIHLPSLRRVIQRTCDRVLGQGVVRRVLIQNITQRQL